MKTVEMPFNFNVKKHQVPFLASEKRFKIAVIHRRGGKTRMALNQQICRAVMKKGIYYYVLPTYTQAKQVIWDELIKDHLPDEIVEKKNDSELAVYYKNGSIQRFVGAEDPDKHRGVNAIDWVFDEYSEMKPEMWNEIAQPILRENKGTASFVFTPRGRNHSWKLLQFAKENEKEWFTTVLPYTKTTVFTPEEIEEAKKSMPESVFRQEIGCEFLDSSTAFFKQIVENVYRKQLRDVSSTQVFSLGIDLAKYQDFTVITPFDQTTFTVYPQERFNQVDWNLQKAKIEAAYFKYGKCQMTIDSTGVGDPIVEDLGSRGLDVVPYHFTEQSRKDLLNNLALLLEQGKIRIPDDEGLIEELQGFQYSLNKNNKLEVRTVLDHDDRVMSLALAVWGCPEKPLGSQRNNFDSGERPTGAFWERKNEWTGFEAV